MKTSYRAELRALLEAVRRAVDPICIICDNKSVADVAAKLFANPTAPLPKAQGDCEDLWYLVRQICVSRPEDHYRCIWIPSHCLEPDKIKKAQ